MGPQLLPEGRVCPFYRPVKIRIRNKKTGNILGSLKRYEGGFSGSDTLCLSLEEAKTLSSL